VIVISIFQPEKPSRFMGMIGKGMASLDSLRFDALNERDSGDAWRSEVVFGDPKARD
jgi:hypothetical protein